jgi:Tfp pilus assembly protein PilF
MTDNHIAKEHFQNGMSEFVSSNFGESIDHLSRAIEADPDFYLARTSRGAAYLKTGRMKEAIEDFSGVIEHDRKNARAFHLRGLAHEKMGDEKAALNDFSEAIEIDPSYGAAYYSRATLLTQMGEEDQAAEDIQMVTHLTEVNIEQFANENNVWRSNQLRLEEMGAADPMDR